MKLLLPRPATPEVARPRRPPNRSRRHRLPPWCPLGHPPAPAVPAGAPAWLQLRVCCASTSDPFSSTSPPVLVVVLAVIAAPPPPAPALSRFTIFFTSTDFDAVAPAAFNICAPHATRT